MRILPATCLALLLATAAGAAKRPAPIATPDGKPVSCVSIPQIRETRVRDDQTIDFIMASGKVYRNTLPYECNRLGFEQAFSYSTAISQVCSVDIITVVSRGTQIPGPRCGLGQFQPVKLTQPPK